MCDFCQEDRTEEHECARCGAVFCLDCGYLRVNETGESDWICYECDAELIDKDKLKASSEKVLDIMASRGLDLRRFRRKRE